MVENANKMQELNDTQNASSPSFETYNVLFKNAKKQYENEDTKLTKVNAEFQKVSEVFLSQCVQISLSLQKDAIPVLRCIRKELGFDFGADSEEYMSIMEQTFNSAESLLEKNLQSLRVDKKPPDPE